MRRHVKGNQIKKNWAIVVISGTYFDDPDAADENKFHCTTPHVFGAIIKIIGSNAFVKWDDGTTNHVGINLLCDEVVIESCSTKQLGNFVDENIETCSSNNQSAQEIETEEPNCLKK